MSPPLLIVVLALAASAVKVSGQVCGGPIAVLPRVDTLIRYKAGLPYGINEKCIWTLTANSTFDAQAQIRVISHGFGSGDGLTIYSLNDEGQGFTHNVTGGVGSLTTFSMQPFAILVFSSDGSTMGHGFEIAVRLSAVTATPRKPFHIETAEPAHGHFRWPASGNYLNNCRLALVLYKGGAVNSGTIEHYIDSMNLHYRDYLMYFRVGDFGTNLAFLKFRTGNVTSPEVFPTVSSNYPVIIIFNSDTSGQGTGFEITWQQLSRHMMKNGSRITHARNVTN